MKNESNIAIETMANAISTVPGFGRLVWNAADKLNDARFAIKCKKEHEATHKTKRGSEYARLVRFEASASEAFFVTIQSLDCIIEAMAPEAEDFAHIMILEEIDEIVSSVSAAEIARNAH